MDQNQTTEMQANDNIDAGAEAVAAQGESPAQPEGPEPGATEPAPSND